MNRREWGVLSHYLHNDEGADEFAEVLQFADRAMIYDVYPAREEYDGSVHSLRI